MIKDLRSFLVLFVLIFLSQSSFAQMDVTIAEIRAADSDGLSLLEGENVRVSGIAIGPNFRPGGLTFVLFDMNDNIGITIFLNNDNLGYGVTDGDDLTITGDVSSFNGLTEVVPTEIVINSQGNAIPDPVDVTTLDETTEGSLIRFKNADLVDPAEWMPSGSFNAKITNGADTIEIRVDSDTNVAGSAAPAVTFNIMGIGGQYDDSAPYDEGYQLFPRSLDDIVDSPLNAEELYQGNIKTYPNPASNYFEIQADDVIQSIRITDLNGKEVFYIKNSSRVEVSDLSNGYYIINVRLDGGVWNQTLIINR